MKTVVINFLYALGLTVCTETVVLFLLVRLLFKYSREKFTNITLIFAGVLASTTTLPYLWFALPEFIHTRMGLLIYGEPGVVIIEALIYRQFLRIKWQEALLVSTACNIISVVMGYYLIR